MLSLLDSRERAIARSMLDPIYLVSGMIFPSSQYMLCNLTNLS